MKTPTAATELSIAPAGPEDYATLADLHGLCLEPAWGREAMAGLFDTPGTLGFIARLEGRPEECTPVGFVLCRRVRDESELLALGVAPQLRCAGIARALLDAAIAAIAKHGVQALFLDVAEDNSAGRALYDAAGFMVVGRRADYYRRAGGDHAAALVLRREITPS